MSSFSTARWPSNLKENLPILSEDELGLCDMLVGLDQDHLFSGWEPPGINDNLKHAILSQVKTLHNSYPVPGGLSAYINRAKLLLAQSMTGQNPFDGWVPEVPNGMQLNPLSKDFFELEDIGKEEVGQCAFVLVAGGLGERLGYSGIKVELPTETVTNTCYLELYCKQIQAIQNRYAKNNQILPFAIMVSDDTLVKTEALLKANDNFGLASDQITLMKQEKVAAICDNDGKIALSSTYEIDAKPHGHGDVHALLYRTGLASKWLKEGIKWVTFFQDTNALALHLLAAMIGVSIEKELEVNSLTIPRYAKQAVGAITKLVHTDGRTMTVNVEYNQLDPLLRSTISPEGDVNDPVTGRSLFPGNINQLLFRLEPYVDVLMRTSGVMGEFVNPKYADATRTTFKKPTRLECMMQDYPKVLGPSSRVGFSTAPSWICYSPVKNNAADAAASVAAGVPAGSAIQGETDQYFAPGHLLRILGAKVDRGEEVKFLDLVGVLSPRIVLDPSFALFPGELNDRFPTPHEVKISSRSTLVIKGDVVVYSLDLDGSLSLAAPAGTRLIVRAGDIKIQNQGHVVESLTGPSSEVLQMRGYSIRCVEQAAFVVEGAPGDYVFLGDCIRPLESPPTTV